MARTGKYRHRVTFQTLAPAAIAVTSLTRSGTTATATAPAHGYASDDRVTLAGAGQAEYNGTVVVTVVDANTFSYTVSGSPATPATGTITATYASDRLRGQRRQWRDLVTVWGWWRALTGREQLVGGQVTAPVTHAIDIRYRSTITPKLRAVVSGKPYEVEAVLDTTGRKRELTVLCVHRQEAA